MRFTCDILGQDGDHGVDETVADGLEAKELAQRNGEADGREEETKRRERERASESDITIEVSAIASDNAR
jgi:hypothetical protein